MSNTLLWVLQGILALAFVVTAVRKFARSDEQIKALAWARDMQPVQVRIIGILELLGALGVILPALTGILPWLTPVAAVGLVILMLGAAATNLRYRLYPPVVSNLVLLILAGVVAYGRFVSPRP